MKRLLLAGACLLALFTGLSAHMPDTTRHLLAQLVVEAGPRDRQQSPVTVALPGLALPPGLSLWLTTDGGEPVPAQWIPGPLPQLAWRLPGALAAGTRQAFQLWAGPAADTLPVAARDDGQSVGLYQQDREILRYVYAETSAPAGVSDRYARGGYIHPLRSPGGAVLSRIQPPDHYHHYGLWHPWTHTRYRGRVVDFWNLYKAEGTVQPLPPVQALSGPVLAEVLARQVHLVFADTSRQAAEPALYEDLHLRLWDGPPGSPALVDLHSTQGCAGPDSLTLLTYRYQGFTLRGPEGWDAHSASLLTSDGHDQATANGSRARWVLVNGPVAGGEAGVLLLSAPTNYNHPQPVRIWPPDGNGGESNIFINFNPTMDRDWPLVPGRRYGLSYRVVTFDGRLDSATAEAYWYDFAYPPQVEVYPLQAQGRPRVLVFTKNGPGYVHANIPQCVAALQELGAAHGFEVDTTTEASWFQPDRLRGYAAIIFANTNNAVFDSPAQRAALQAYVSQGGGIVGIHSACGTERDWPWFWEMMGGKFLRHPPRQTFDLEVLDPQHPSTAHLPARWTRWDECYLMTELNPATRVLLAADLRTVADEQRATYPDRTFGDRFPLAWCQTFAGGRQWFTALGHEPAAYQDPVFRQHLLGGILWAIGQAP